MASARSSAVRWASKSNRLQEEGDDYPLGDAGEESAACLATVIAWITSIKPTAHATRCKRAGGEGLGERAEVGITRPPSSSAASGGSAGPRSGARRVGISSSRGRRCSGERHERVAPRQGQRRALGVL
ncbi:MAG: hypothetical protein U0470_02950 [Anaerolineae bacterium]